MSFTSTTTDLLYQIFQALGGTMVPEKYNATTEDILDAILLLLGGGGGGSSVVPDIRAGEVDLTAGLQRIDYSSKFTGVPALITKASGVLSGWFDLDILAQDDSGFNIDLPEDAHITYIATKLK